MRLAAKRPPTVRQSAEPVYEPANLNDLRKTPIRFRCSPATRKLVSHKMEQCGPNSPFWPRAGVKPVGRIGRPVSSSHSVHRLHRFDERESRHRIPFEHTISGGLAQMFRRRSQSSNRALMGQPTSTTPKPFSGRRSNRGIRFRNVRKTLNHLFLHCFDYIDLGMIPVVSLRNCPIRICDSMNRAPDLGRRAEFHRRNRIPRRGHIRFAQ